MGKPCSIQARAKIIQAANGYRRRIWRNPVLLSGAQLNRAVCIVRRNRLVKPGVLIEAGFNPKIR